MLSILCNGRNQTIWRHFLRGTVFVVLAICGFFDTGKNAFAQQNSRPVTYQTTKQANQTVSPARQVAVPEPVKPVPDFWAIHSDGAAMLIAHDRLDRKNLPMLYHFSFDQYHRVELPVLPSGVPSVAITPEPQYRNHPNDLETRLYALRESMEGGNRAFVPTTPSPSSTEDSQQPAAVRIRRLPAVHGIVAVGDL